MFIPRPLRDTAPEGGPPTTPPETPPETTPAPTGETPPGPTIESLQAELKKVRGEAAAARTKSRDDAKTKAAAEATTEVTAKIAAALGIQVGDAPPSIDDALASIADRDATIIKMKLDTALSAAAIAAGANASTLIPYLRGIDALSGLKPEAEDFDKTVETLVVSTLEAHPQFKGGQVPPKSGPTDIPPGGGDKGQLGQDAIAGMSDEEFDKAVVDGRFKSLLGGNK